MSGIKSKVYLDDKSYIDFETKSFRYNNNEIMKSRDLNVDELIILKCLCLKYNSVVYNSEIFEFLYEKAYDAENDDMQPLSRIISRLRKKVSKGNGSFIELKKNGCYCLPLKEPPFEVDAQNEANTKPLPTTTIDFFAQALSNESELGKVDSIDMAFHLGSLWLLDGKKFMLLRKAIENGIKIRIVVNTLEQVKNIFPHTSQEGQEYLSFDENSHKWEKFMMDNLSLVEFHIAKVPLLHRTYIIRNKENDGWANITYYSYGKHDKSENQSLSFRSKSKEYQRYLEEFNYIWENASEPYSEIDSTH